jgi:hypothetical protein
MPSLAASFNLIEHVGGGDYGHGCPPVPAATSDGNDNDQNTQEGLA